jgi:hypothetical protein
LQILESEALGLVDIPLDEHACGMPVSVQIERLRSQLNDRWGDAFTILSTDLGGLEDAERHAVLDAIIANEPSPYVLVNGQLVCMGALEIDAVVGALV